MEEQQTPDDSQRAKKRSGNGAEAAEDGVHAAGKPNGQHSSERKGPDQDGNAQRTYRHGLLAQHLVRLGPLSESDSEAYPKLVDRLRMYYLPVGFMEEFMVEKIAAEMVRYARVFGHEQARLGYSSGFHYPEIATVLRYSIYADRQLTHSIRELERMQAEREKVEDRNSRPVSPIPDDDAVIFPLGMIPPYTKSEVQKDQPNSQSKPNITVPEKTETKLPETKPYVSGMMQALNAAAGLPADYDPKKKAADWKPEPAQDNTESAPSASSVQKNPKLRNEPKGSRRTNGNSSEEKIKVGDKPHNPMG